MIRPIIGYLAALLVVLGSDSQTTRGQTQHVYQPEVGQLHHDFSLPSVDGKRMIRLSDFRGKKLLLFHFASW